jgi:uncharacterized protein
MRLALILLAAALGVPPTEAPARHAPATADDWRDSVRLLNEQRFHHTAWGTAHSRRDYDLARSLADSEHLTYDDDVLYAAAYLHDIAAFAPWAKAGTDHQDRGADLMDSVLTHFGFPVEKIGRVKDAVRTHMPGRSPGAAVESRLLHDADGLDWLGAVGIARIVSLVDANGGDPNFSWAVRRLRDDAGKVPATMSTPTAKREAARRAARTIEFLDELSRESKELDEL